VRDEKEEASVSHQAFSSPPRGRKAEGVGAPFLNQRWTLQVLRIICGVYIVRQALSGPGARACKRRCLASAR